MMKWFDRTFSLGLGVELLPTLLERLRGTPLRLEGLVRSVPEDTLEASLDGSWSVKENVGHLSDLEPLWYGRLEDLFSGIAELRPADLTNRKTQEARHNDRPLDELMARFRAARGRLVEQLTRAAPEETAKTAIHPRLGQRMGLADLLFFVAEHDDHHLARIRHICELQGTSGQATHSRKADRWIPGTILEGKKARLVPLGEGHSHDLWSVGQHPELWRWMPTKMETLVDFEIQVRRALGWAEAGWGQSFVIEAKDTAAVIGSTSYLAADADNLRLEIGWTWITPDWQRTSVNTECKWLLMRHAFEELGARRIEFKTDSKNERSRVALVRIGATEEGTLRDHMVRPDGSARHSTCYSVTVEEWPAVNEHLLGMLDSAHS